MQNKKAIQLIDQIKSEELLHELIMQLNKDADLTGLDVHFDISSTPKNLLKELYDILLNLMTQDFQSYLNFLYRIDVSEKSLRSMPETDPKQIAATVTLMVLKREWQKVSFRNKIR